MKNALMAVGLTAVVSLASSNMVSASTADKSSRKAPDKSAAKTPEAAQAKGTILNLKEFSFTFPADFGPYQHTTEYVDTDGEGKVPKEHYTATNKQGESFDVAFAGYPSVPKDATSYNIANMQRDALLVKMLGGITKENLVDFGPDEGLNLYFTCVRPGKTIQGRAYFYAKAPRYRYDVVFQSLDPKRLDAPDIAAAFQSFKPKNF